MSGPSIGDGYRRQLRVAALVRESLVRTEAGTDPGFREQVRLVHALGPRIVGELLLELRDRLDADGWFDARLWKYSTLSPATIATIDVADWPKRAAVMVIDGGKR